MTHSSTPIAVNAMAQTVRADLFSSKPMMELPVIKQGKTITSRVICYFRSRMAQCQSFRGCCPNTGSFDPFDGMLLAHKCQQIPLRSQSHDVAHFPEGHAGPVRKVFGQRYQCFVTQDGPAQTRPDRAQKQERPASDYFCLQAFDAMWRRQSDLNRCITVLQTAALPLGYAAQKNGAGNGI